MCLVLRIVSAFWRRVTSVTLPAALLPGRRPGTRCVGCRVGPRSGLDGCGKSRPPPGFDPRIFTSAPSCYTDCAIPAHDVVSFVKNCLVRAVLFL
jgi:hypothetical protein